jgi:translation elongation factor EF-Ts
LDASTVADETALMLGNIGENMLARRAVFFKAAEKQQLFYYVHAASRFEFICHC